MNSLPRPCLRQNLHSLFTTTRISAVSTCVLQPPTTSTTTITVPSIHQQQTRHASTARRQRKLLQLPPASFLNGPLAPTGSSGRSRTALVDAPTHDHIVFTPPPSAPNVYHTPPIFLPKDDVRRRLFEEQDRAAALIKKAARPQSQAQQPTTASPVAQQSPTAPTITSHYTTLPASTSPRWPRHLALPPPVRQPYEKTYHLNPADIEEMRALRLEDETKWTRGKLAERFQCSPLFVGMVVQASGVRRKEVERVAQGVRARWGARRRKARVERGRRREGWGRGE